MANHIRTVFTEEVEQYIREHIIGKPYADMAEELSNVFDHRFTGDGVKKFCERKSITNYVNKWSEEEKQYLIQHINDGKTYQQLADEINPILGLHRTAVQVQNQCYFLGLSNGLDTKYHMGHAPTMSRPIGTEVCHGDRKTYVKVSDDYRGSKYDRHGHEKNYRLKHELIWEETHGQPIPEKHIVIFVDGDRNNFDPGNLLCVPNSIKTEMNARRWQFEDCPEMRKTAIACCLLRKECKDDTPFH